MTHDRILGLVFLLILGTVGIVSGADAPVLVFKDGSTIDVASLSIERGSVVIELADGRKQQFDKRDIDLEASGLIPATPVPSIPAARQKMAPKLVMPGDDDGNRGVTISDKDVGHVRPTRRGFDADDGADDEDGAAEIIPLRISDVRHFEQEGGVNVTGTVTNDGINDLENTTVTGYAVDADQKNLGQGSVGLASILAQGASKRFSLMIPVSGEIDAVKVTASASEIKARQPTPAGNERPSESGGGSAAAPSTEDRTPSNNAD